MQDLSSELVFLFQRVNWLTVLDILLVGIIFYVILIMLRNTQAMTLMRGVIFLIIAISLLTTLVNLPAFSWLVNIALPTLLFAIPVIFAPEIRRGLERLGRAGSGALLLNQPVTSEEAIHEMIQAVTSACVRLAAHKYGALVVIERKDHLQEYIDTGVMLNANVTPELLLQIFHPNTPLHDGAVIVQTDQISAAACVMPLSSRGVLARSPERQMGLRHRAALGISEASDALAVVVSEETGGISVAHRGRIIRRIGADKLENVLLAFFKAEEAVTKPKDLLDRVIKWFRAKKAEED